MKNGKANDLETRLARLEADMSEIKSILRAKGPESQKSWWEEMIGIFADPVSREILQCGTEIREKERHKVKRARNKSRH